MRPGDHLRHCSGLYDEQTTPGSSVYRRDDAKRLVYVQPDLQSKLVASHTKKNLSYRLDLDREIKPISYNVQIARHQGLSCIYGLCIGTV